MSDRLHTMSDHHRTRTLKRVKFPLALFALCLAVLGCAWLSARVRAVQPPPMQLVRLSVTSSGGMVRIEITADGSFDEATVEQQTRGRQSLIRIRGARSLLRSNYAIDDEVARAIRTVSGEMNGEPYVDILISLNEGATIAQRKNFNRLIIGIASDFAGLRRKRDAPNADLQARDEAKTKPARSVSVAKADVTDKIPATPAAAETAAVNTQPSDLNTVSTSDALPETSTDSTAQLRSPSNPAEVAPLSVFRGRTIWNSLPSEPRRSLRLRDYAIAPLGFRPLVASLKTPSSPLNEFTPVGLDAPGETPGVWVPGTTASASDDVGGRPLGAGVLRPLFQFGAEFDDNFFYRSTVGRNLVIFTFAPRLEYELPGEKRALRLAYEARLRRLSNGQWANGQVLDFDARFNFTQFFRLAVRNHLIRSALDPREYDPAGEVYIVGDTFTRNDAGLRLEYLMTNRSRLAFDAGYNIVRWSEDRIASAPQFINYDDLSAAVSYERDISEQSTALLSFSFNTAGSGAPLRPQFDGLSDSKSYQLEIGVRRQVTETSGVALRVGFERSLFPNAPSANKYSGLVFDLRLRSDLTEKTNFELAALRKTQLSAFNLEGGNARLVSTGGAARLERSLTDALKLGLGLSYQRLRFPLALVPDSTASGGVFIGDFAGQRRADHLYGFGFDVGYRWSELLNTRFAYEFSRRDSSIPVFTFNSNRMSLIFDFGRRNETKGRPF